MKKILAVLALCLMMAQTAMAQSVVVDGFGTDESAARKDAARMAVESVAGTYIASRTLTENYAVTLDEIYAQAQGFVTGMEVISSENTAQGWHVRARVDVNDSPDSALMSRLNMVALLNNPRIAVVVMKKEPEQLPLLSQSNVSNRYESSTAHDVLTEQALNDQLLEVGFTHVVEANQVARLQNDELLNSIYRGDTGLVAESGNRPIDYLVLGLSEVHAYDINLPDGKGGYRKTNMKSAGADLSLRVVDYATGNIVATIKTEGKGVENSDSLAENRALKDAAAKAAVKLEEKFKKTAMKVHQGVTVTVKADSLEKVEMLAAKLREVSGVQNAILRSFNNGVGVIDVESAQKPHVLVSGLKGMGLNIFVSSVSSSELKLTLH